MSTKEDAVGVMDTSTEEFYQNFDQTLRRFKHMNLARWKLAQNSLISILVFLLAWKTGADPTVSVGVIAVINGISFADLAAVWNNPQTQSPQQDDETPEVEAKKR